MAYGNGRSSFWRKKRNSVVVEKRGIESQRPMLMEEVSIKMAQSNRQTEQEGEVEETTQQKENIRVITGFVDDEKLELLSRCALGFCRKPQQIMDLANEFLRADLVGFKIMGVIGFIVLRRLSVCKLRVMCFGCVLWKVDGLLGLTGEEESGEDRQQDVKDAISPTLCSVDLGLGQFVHAFDVSKSVVPESPKNTGSPIWHMNRLWEDNMVEDWRVLELPNAESGEVGNAMIMAEVGEPGLEIPIEVLEPSERSMELIDVGPRSEVPRAGKAVTIELNGEQRRIRQLSEINLSILSPVERCEAERRLKKKGRGRPRKKPLPEQGIANASLSDSDFIQRQHVILREARETIHLGRLIGVETVGNEEDIVKDIARIIEARGTRCGKYGHLSETCPGNPSIPKENDPTPPEPIQPHDSVSSAYGPWMQVDKRQRRPIHKPQTKDHKHTNKRFMGSRFNPIYEDDEDLQTTEGLQGVEDVLAPSPTKNTRPDHKQKGKQPTVYKHPRAIHVRKPLQVTLNDFPIVSRFTSKGSSSRSVPSTLKTSHLDKSRHSAVVLSENTEPSPCLVIDAPGNHQLSDNPLILSDPPDTHTNKHPNPVAFGAHQDHAKPGIKAIEPVDTYEADMLD
ncbi:hypothetical protein V6N13_036159 [Hibiscus sabdariffa]